MIEKSRLEELLSLVSNSNYDEGYTPIKATPIAEAVREISQDNLQALPINPDGTLAEIMYKTNLRKNEESQVDYVLMDEEEELGRMSLRGVYVELGKALVDVIKKVIETYPLENKIVKLSQGSGTYQIEIVPLGE